LDVFEVLIDDGDVEMSLVEDNVAVLAYGDDDMFARQALRW